MFRHSVLSGLVLVLLACGEDIARRSIELELVGLLSSAEVVILKVLRADEAPPCEGLTPEAAAALGADQTATWIRSDGQPRSLQLPGLDESEVVIVAAVLDQNSLPIQVGCERFDFAGLERPEVEIELR